VIAIRPRLALSIASFSFRERLLFSSGSYRSRARLPRDDLVSLLSRATRENAIENAPQGKRRVFSGSGRTELDGWKSPWKSETRGEVSAVKVFFKRRDAARAIFREHVRLNFRENQAPEKGLNQREKRVRWKLSRISQLETFDSDRTRTSAESALSIIFDLSSRSRFR